MTLMGLERRGEDLLGAGIKLVAKISLWESQSDLVKMLFWWSENNDFLYEWYETVYQNQSRKCAKKEISFVYFLTDENQESFAESIPKDLKRFVRWETFDPTVFDHYSGARAGKAVDKYPECDPSA